MNHKISVLIIDDSAFMRKSLSLMLESDQDIKVISTARNGQEGYELVKNLKPDVVTLDIEMPVMDGLTALKKIMADCPTSVIMVSSLTTEGADSTLKALELGAVDFIPKELSYVNVNITKIKEDLISKVKEIVKQKLLKERLNRLRAISQVDKREVTIKQLQSPIPQIGYKAVAIGISTGGPLSLQKIIPIFSERIQIPIFIVQHMPPKFTKSLADRLNSLAKLNVKEAENGEPVERGTIYIAPGGFHMTVQKNGLSTPQIAISEQPANTLHRPSVDVMMNSVINHYGKYTLGVIMTGMGKDGFEAIKNLKSLGGYSIAQDEQSCVVYGMPKAVVDAGYADNILPLEKIPEIINKVV